MDNVTKIGDRRTTVDAVFDYLHDQILTLKLRPGAKISEADIAATFGVSRQPVRDAFSRLANLDLLLIRPQRATEVKRFSKREIAKSRFVRTSVEKEVLLRAAQNCDAEDAKLLDGQLDDQRQAVKDKDVERFGELDYSFHKTLCGIADAEFAFDVIMAEKSKVDRLCMLGLSKESRMPELFEDHRAIAEAVKNNDPKAATDIGVLHLSRLDETIESISRTNANYFEPDDT